MRKPVDIHRKLSSISLITTGVGLLVTTVLFLAGEVVSIRDSSLRELRILNEAIASNSTAALAFDVPEDARTVLAAFRSDPDFVAAALYKLDGQLFVTYPDTPPAGAVPATAPAPGYALRGSALTGVASVSEGSMPLGTLYVRSDMSAVYERLAFYAVVAALVIALAMFTAWLISRRLQRQLSEPILQLAQT